MVEGESKLKQPTPLLSYCPSISRYNLILHPFPEELGNTVARMSRRAKQVGFSDPAWIHATCKN